MQVYVVLLVICVTVVVGQWKAGDCPPKVQISECSMTCRNDFFCTGNLKCCRTACGGTTCVEAVTSKRIENKVKPGHCPISRNWVCSNRCSLDSDCRGRKKCCQNRCGAMECIMPLPAAPKES